MKNKRRLSDKEWNYIYSKVPRLCVDLIIVKDKKVLLTKRSIPPFKGFWHLPGGGVLHREKINDAIIRIAKDELGVKVKIQKFLGWFELLKDGPNRHSITLIFRVKVLENKKPKTLEQASGYAFFDMIPQKIGLHHKKFLKENWVGIFN